MKKLFAVLFLVGSMATLRADYYGGCSSGEYGQMPYGAQPSQGFNQYGYQESPYGYNQGYQPQQQNQPSQGTLYSSNQPGRPGPVTNQPSNRFGFSNNQPGQPSQGAAFSQPYSQSQNQPYAQPNARSNLSNQPTSQSNQANPFSNQAYGDEPAGSASYGYGASAQQGAQSGQSIQQQLTSRIQDAVRNLSDKYNNVNVSLNNGTVTLRGTVASQEDKSNLERLVRGLEGVLNVDNQVTVQSQPANSNPSSGS